jgi:hypothetical protein
VKPWAEPLSAAWRSSTPGVITHGGIAVRRPAGGIVPSHSTLLATRTSQVPAYVPVALRVQSSPAPVLSTEPLTVPTPLIVTLTVPAACAWLAPISKSAAIAVAVAQTLLIFMIPLPILVARRGSYTGR